MKNHLLVLLSLLAVLTGCSGKSHQAFSVPSPAEYEKMDVGYVMVFWGMLDIGTWGVENVNGGGVWPLEAEQPDGKNFVGLILADSLNDWADFTALAMMVGRKQDLLDSKIAFFDRDRGKVHSPAGYDSESGAYEYDYNPKKFKTDKKYAHEVFQNGKTLRELQEFWREYAEDRGIPPETFESREYKVGSPEWEEFKALLAQYLKYNYVMANGEVRATYIPTQKEFEDKSYNNHGVTAWERFLRNVNVSLAPDLGLATSLINGLIDASVGPIEGIYAQAECLRGDLKPSFRLLQGMFQKILWDRDEKIHELKRELQKKEKRR